MSALEDAKVFMAWGHLVYGHTWSKPPPDPTEFAKEIAKALRLGEPIPPFAQKWLADLLDPPPGQGGEFKLIFKRDGYAARKLETELRDYRKALEILEAKQSGLSTRKAVDKIGGEGMRALRSAKRFMHPWLLAWLNLKDRAE
jgi:hypothetical protein